MLVAVLHHFSEDPSIERFDPHVPLTNPTHEPAVWAIDSAHAPLYWFPRNCPRVTAWPRNEGEQLAFQHTFHTTALRFHATEIAWTERMNSTELFRYDFDPAAFEPWPAADGQFIATSSVVPIAVTPVGNLLDLHTGAGIELRFVEALRPLAAMAASDKWGFSIVRLANTSGPPL
jgi:hypothetical protein